MDVAGRSADQIARLWWGMAIGTVVVFGVMVALTLMAQRSKPPQDTARITRTYIIGGGIVFPVVVLTGLLVYGLALMPDILGPAPPGSLRIHVVGEQWWWRVRYLDTDGQPVELANEIRLPVGEPVEFTLESPDVIHAFWIPSLGGKMDMIPGRRTRLRLDASRTGTFRGVCAEYCGDSHALMAFDVVVMPKEEFIRWLEDQRRPAAPPTDELALRGQTAFFANGCSACHVIAGTEARGVVGPDLTHVGGRLSLGAGTLPNDRDSFVRWIAETGKVKPGVLMPHFGMLPAEELQGMAAYLESLK